jgi:hypothetical protein
MKKETAIIYITAFSIVVALNALRVLKISATVLTA